MWEKSQRVLGVHELLISIARELESKEHPKLMLVSKYFFRSIGPMVWKSVPRLDFILKLVKGTEVEFDGTEDSKQAHYEFTRIIITLPPNPDLSRYHIYAPWVQQLEIFGGCSQEIYYAGRFLAHFRGLPPLQNLRRLTTYTGAENMSSKLLMNFVDMFISPSLTDIRIKFHEKGCSTYTHPSSTLGFLKKVQNTCPEIQALEFYPGIRFVYNSAEPSPFDEQCRDVLQTFSNLCSFSSTTRILDSKTFGVLGNLPRLESLGVRGSRMDLPVLDERLSIPAHWFKKLIDLQLYDVHPQDIKLLWGQPSMVTKLGSVLIQTDPTTAPKPLVESKDGNRWIESFLLGLSTLSPHLYDFTFYVGDEDGTMFQISEGAQNSLRNLKLKNTKIRLRNTYGVDENSEDEGYDYGDYPLA